MDLIDALTAANIDYHPGRDETEIYLCCPMCNDERFRLGVNVQNGRAHCFNDGCEWSSRGEYTFRKLQEVLDTGEIEAQQERRKRKKKRMEKLDLPEGFILLSETQYSDSGKEKAWAYVRKRGISSDQIKDKKIGYTSEGKYARRVIFPVYLNGTLVGFSGRDITGEQDPKYKNSIGSKCIYNLPEKKHSTCVLTESAIPALVVERVSHKMGIDSLGLLGHSLQDGQVSLLKHYRRVILWMDPDTAGVQGLVGTKTESKGIYHKLKEEGKSVKVVLPKGMLDNDSYDERDPDEMDLHEIGRRLEHAENMNDSLVLKLKNWMAFDE
jgi:DNA primase